MYLLSIVVPTRNRQKFCLEAVKQILSVTDERVQIVVTDNSDENTLERQFNLLCSSRIKYEFICTRIPGVDNYARGIELSEGEYVCCIGDDDGILRNIIPVVFWMKKNGIDAIKPGVQATYFWPNSAKEYDLGCVGLKKITDRAVVVNPQNELINFLEAGIIDFPNAKLVKAYHGIVKRGLFEIIKNRTGKYCGGLSPDIYLSAALSCVVNSLVCIDIPISIFGACRASTTADSINKINMGKLEDAPHFIGQAYEWSSLVPRYYCGSNIWADSALHALQDMGKGNLFNHFALDKFSGYSMVYYKSFKKEIMNNYLKNNGDIRKLKKEIRKNILPYYISIVKGVVRRQKVLINLLRKIRDKKQKTSGEENLLKTDIKNISVAESMISEIVMSHMNIVLKNLNNTGALE